MVWYENYVKLHRFNYRQIFNFCKMYGKEVTWIKLNTKENTNINIKKYSLVNGQGGPILKNDQNNYKFYNHYIILPFADLYLADSDAPPEISDILVPLSSEFIPESGDKIQWYSLDRQFEYAIKSVPKSLERQYFSVDLTLIKSSVSKMPRNIPYDRIVSDGDNRILPDEEQRISIIKFKE